MRVTIACVAVAVAVAANGAPVSRLNRAEEATLARLLNAAVAQQRSPDRWLHWSGHFLKGLHGETYVPYTVSLDVESKEFREVAVGIRVVGRSGWRDGFAVETEDALDGRLFRGAFSARPGRHRVLIAIQDRLSRSRSTALLEQAIDVPDFSGRALQISSVIVAERIDQVRVGATAQERAAFPYALGSANIVPVRSADFTVRDNLTLAFQIYNAATFADGRPDVEVRYSVYRGEEKEHPVASTKPQSFNQETLPEDFTLKDGLQLTPSTSLPLAKFEPGPYRLQIEVEDFLGNARTVTGES